MLRPVILFGDSLTQQGFGIEGKVGWASLLAAAYTRRADILNRGFSGYNTNHALEILPRVFGTTSNDALFCTLFWGANDAALVDEPQHVPIEQYAKNLSSMVASIRSRQNSKPFPIILMTPPPVDEDAWAAWREIDVSDRRNDVVRAYGEKMKEVARELSCPVVDTWELLQGSTENRHQYLSDGLHLSEKGNRAVYEGLMTLLKSQFADLAPMEDDDGEGKYGKSGLPMKEKLWKELCGIN
jgi:lysophospholipase L1-like esterase